MEDPGWEGWGMKQSYPYLSYCLTLGYGVPYQLMKPGIVRG